MSKDKKHIGKVDNLASLRENKLKNADFKKLSEFIHRNYGIYLSDKKYYLLQNRLVKRLRELGMDNFSEYTQFVLNRQEGKDEILEMVDAITTNKTDFFREKQHFDFLSEILKKEFVGSTIKVWSAGCSTGQEAYSLCMILEESRQQNGIADYMVYGNDISYKVLETAKKGIYPYKLYSQIPVEFRKKYLLKSKNQNNPKIRIVPELRNKTYFFWMNLAQDNYPLQVNFQFIFCRNTLIYFDRDLQQKIITLLSSFLVSGGYLFIGHSESLINLNTDGLRFIKPTIYQKI